LGGERNLIINILIKISSISDRSYGETSVLEPKVIEFLPINQQDARSRERKKEHSRLKKTVVG